MRNLLAGLVAGLALMSAAVAQARPAQRDLLFFSAAATEGQERYTRGFEQNADTVFQAALRAMAKQFWTAQYYDETARVIQLRSRPGWKGGTRTVRLSVRPGAGRNSEAVLLTGSDSEGFAKALFSEIEKEIAKPTPHTESLVYVMVTSATDKQAAGGTETATDAEPLPVARISAPLEQIRARLVAYYASHGYLVESDRTYQIGFWKDQPPDPELLGTVLPVKAEPRSYRQTVTFAFTPLDAQVAVVPQVELWDQTQPTSSHVNITGIASVRKELEKALAEVARSLEGGAAKP